MSSVLHSPQPNSLESSCWYHSLIDGCIGTMMKIKSTLHSTASPFQKIEVVDTYSFGRMLILAGTVVFTEKDEHVYNEMVTHPALMSHPAPREICIIGGGDGGSLREALKHPSVTKVTVVEIDKMVTETVKRFFPLLYGGFRDERTELVFEDGYQWLKKSKRTFDVIIVDSYDPGGPIQSLGTDDFFELVDNSLADGGYAVFLTSSPELNRDKIRSAINDLSVKFPLCKPYTATMPSFPLGLCSFVLCGKAATAAAPIDRSRIEHIADTCQYYSPAMQQGAFLLPKSVADVFGINGDGVAGNRVQ
jgi:spermidine synthase